MNVLATTGLALVLAFLVESFVEYGFGTPMDKIPELQRWKWLLMYVAMVVGVVLALYYKLDLMSVLVQLANGSLAPSWVGMVASGLVIGRGANYASDFVSKYLTKPG